MDFFERKAVTLKKGTSQIIEGYVNNYPSLFDNYSHFVRCALNREFRRLRSEGKFSTQKEVLQND